MGILNLILTSLDPQKIQSSVVLNALIELDNNDGSTGLYELEYRLARIVRTLGEVRDPVQKVAKVWLDCTRTYIQTWYSPEVHSA